MKASSIVWHKLTGNMLVIGSHRASKTEAIARPAALAYDGSLVVVETAGELFTQTAAYREQTFNQQIVYIDPMSEFSAGLNPLDLLNPKEKGFYHEVEEIASVIIGNPIPPENNYVAQMNLMARSALSVAIATKVLTCCEAKPTLKEVIDFLHDTPENLRKKFNDITKAANGDDGIYGEHFFDILCAAALLASVNDNMLVAVEATIKSAAYGIHDCDFLSRTTFDISKLRDGKMSLYINFKRDFADRYSSALDILMYSVLDTLSAPKKTETLIVWDDLDFTSSLLQKRSDILTRCQEHGIHIIGICTTLRTGTGPSYDAYARRWLTDADYIIAGAINFPEDAESISAVLGTTVCYSRSFPGRVVTKQRRRVIDPHEMWRLPKDRFLLIGNSTRQYSPMGKLAMKLPDGSFVENEWLHGKGNRFPYDAERDADGKPVKPPVPESVKASSLAATAF